MQEQADTSSLTTTKIVKHKSIVCGMFPKHAWVVTDMSGNDYGIVEYKSAPRCYTEIVLASRPIMNVPLSAYALLAMSVFLLCAAVIIPTLAVHRKP
ncbi:hypothetical protein BH11VER1_BH11VER1_38570 [soil metagenome]